MQIPPWLRRGRRGGVDYHDIPVSPTSAPDQHDVITFQTLMFTAKEIAKRNHAVLPALIAAILRPEQSELILRVAEQGKFPKNDVFG